MPGLRCLLLSIVLFFCSLLLQQVFLLVGNLPRCRCRCEKQEQDRVSSCLSWMKILAKTMKLV